MQRGYGHSNHGLRAIGVQDVYGFDGLVSRDGGGGDVCIAVQPGSRLHGLRALSSIALCKGPVTLVLRPVFGGIPKGSRYPYSRYLSLKGVPIYRYFKA